MGASMVPRAVRLQDVLAGQLGQGLHLFQER